MNSIIAKAQREYLSDAQSKYGDLVKWQVFSQKQVKFVFVFSFGFGIFKFLINFYLILA